MSATPARLPAKHASVPWLTLGSLALVALVARAQLAPHAGIGGGRGGSVTEALRSALHPAPTPSAAAGAPLDRPAARDGRASRGTAAPVHSTPGPATAVPAGPVRAPAEGR